MNHLSMYMQRTLKCKFFFKWFWKITSSVSTVFKESLNICLFMSMQSVIYASKSSVKMLKEMIIVSSSHDVFCVFFKKAYRSVSNFWWQGLTFLALMKRVFVEWCLWSFFLFFRTCWILHCECKICLIRSLRQTSVISLSLNCFLRTGTFTTALEYLMIFHRVFLKCIWLKIRGS